MDRNYKLEDVWVTILLVDAVPSAKVRYRVTHVVSACPGIIH